MIKKLIDDDKNNVKTEKILKFLGLLKEYKDVTCEDHELLTFVKKSEMVKIATGYFMYENNGDSNTTDICVSMTMRYLEKTNGKP